MKERRAVTKLESGLVVLVIILAGTTAYGFTLGAPTGGTVTTTATGAQSQLSKLKVALILPIDPTDNSWNYQADFAVKQLQKAFGFSLNETFNKFDGTSAEPAAVNYAQKGFNVIFLQGIQYQTMASKIAPQYPNTLFVCVDCLARNSSNIYLIWLDLGGAGFIVGAMAGKLTRSNTIGLVGGGRVPSIWAGHEGFKAGALYTNPNVSFKETYEKFSWADVAGAKQTADQEIASGADIVFSSGDGIDVGVISSALASSSPVWATNVYSNLSAIRSDVNKVLLASIVVDWTVPYAAALRAYVSGTWRNGFLTANTGSGIVKVQPGPNVPANVKQLAATLQRNFLTQSLIMSFKTNPQTGNPLCFDQPTLAACADTSLSTIAAQLNYLP